jgi:hypothetical protein
MNYFRRLQKSAKIGHNVIGRTQSGKNVYSSFNHPEHASFTPKEHMEARELHASTLYNMRQFGESDHAFDQKVRHHVNQMKQHSKAAVTKGTAKPNYITHFRNSYNKLQASRASNSLKNPISKQETQASPPPPPPPPPSQNPQPTSTDSRAGVSQSFKDATGMTGFKTGINNLKQWAGFGKAEKYFKSKRKR